MSVYIKTNNISVKKHLYVSMIRSQQMYCLQLWRPRHIVIRKSPAVIYQIYIEWLYIWLLYQTYMMYVYELNDLIFFIKSLKQPSHSFDIAKW